MGGCLDTKKRRPRSRNRDGRTSPLKWLYRPSAGSMDGRKGDGCGLSADANAGNQGFIGGEVFGFAYLPYFVIVCSLAFALNGNESIYGKQQILE